jgi:hypothetical protein
VKTTQSPSPLPLTIQLEDMAHQATACSWSIHYNPKEVQELKLKRLLTAMREVTNAIEHQLSTESK